VVEKRRAHLDPDPPDEPQVVRHPPPRLLDVVDRHVLQEARDRVEPDPPRRPPCPRGESGPAPGTTARRTGSATRGRASPYEPLEEIVQTGAGGGAEPARYIPRLADRGRGG